MVAGYRERDLSERTVTPKMTLAGLRALEYARGSLSDEGLVEEVYKAMSARELSGCLEKPSAKDKPT